MEAEMLNLRIGEILAEKDLPEDMLKISFLVRQYIKRQCEYFPGLELDF